MGTCLAGRHFRDINSNTRNVIGTIGNICNVLCRREQYMPNLNGTTRLSRMPSNPAVISQHRYKSCETLFKSRVRGRRNTRYMAFNQNMFPASGKPPWIEGNQWLLDTLSAVSACSFCDYARYKINVFEVSSNSSWREG